MDVSFWFVFPTKHFRGISGPSMVKKTETACGQYKIGSRHEEQEMGAAAIS